jgi:hypothetical protein
MRLGRFRRWGYGWDEGAVEHPFEKYVYGKYIRI